MCLRACVRACVLDLFVARSMSTTFDESSSVADGEQVLRCQPDRSDPLFNSKAPVAALNAAPRVLAVHLNNEEVAPCASRAWPALWQRWSSMSSYIAGSMRSADSRSDSSLHLGGVFPESDCTWHIIEQ
jgi:hypothetical protein